MVEFCPGEDRAYSYGGRTLEEISIINKNTLEHFPCLKKMVNRLCVDGLTINNGKVSDSELVEILECARMPQVKDKNFEEGIRNYICPYIPEILNSTIKKYTRIATDTEDGEIWLKQEETRRIRLAWGSGKSIYIEEMIFTKGS